MISRFSPLLVALALALSGPALAQDDTTTEAPDENLSLGEAAEPENYVREVSGDWEVQCIRALNGGEDPCQMYQLLKDQDGNSVAEISIFRIPEGGQAVAGGTIVTPLETLLTRQITLSIDEGAGRRYPFSFCSGIGCIARVGFTADEVAAMKRGNAGQMVIYPVAAPDTQVLLTVSLSGFTKAFDSLPAPVPNQ